MSNTRMKALSLLLALMIAFNLVTVTAGATENADTIGTRNELVDRYEDSFFTDQELELQPISEIEAFEDEIRRAGRIVAENRGLLVNEEELNQFRVNYSRTELNEYAVQDFYQNVRANSVTLEEIYYENPALAHRALSIQGLDSSYLEPFSQQTSPTPSFGDYRLQTYYTYSNRTEYDSVQSKTYAALANISVGIISIGLKPAQAIIVTVLQNVVPANSWSTNSDYRVTTLYDRCVSGRWGEVYTPGGLLMSSEWRGYCYAQREDTYSIAVASAWRGNTLYSNTSKSALVSYKYDNKFYDTSYLKTRALELYKTNYDASYTILYGVIAVILEYNMKSDVSWKTSLNNPFA